MRKFSFIITLLVVLLLFPRVDAGIGLFEGFVKLKPFQKVKTCGLIVYNAIPTRAHFTVQYTDEIQKFVEKIEPNEFYLDPVNCTGSGQEKRNCIMRECKNPESTSCRVVCTTFKGPFELEWNPKERLYPGAVRAVIRVRATELVEVAPFQVSYTPFSMKVFVAIITTTIVVIVIISFLLYKKFKKRKKTTSSLDATVSGS